MKRFLFIGLMILSYLSCFSQEEVKKDVTYDQLSRGVFSARSIGGLRSMKDGEHYTARVGNSIVKYNYSTGDAVDTLYKGGLKFGNYDLSQHEDKIILKTEIEPVYRHSAKANFFIYDIASGVTSALSKGGKQQEATLSPDGTKAAFVRNNNLFVVDLVNGVEKQITSDGRPGEIIYGIPDWVYEEEYSFSRAYEWSPASDAIAFYRFDERNVKSYNMNYFDTMLYPQNVTFKYPKAGEENSKVEIKVYNLKSEKTTGIDIGTETDIYIPRIKWTGRPDVLAVSRLNRHQNRYDLLLADVVYGVSKAVYSEASDTYVERIDDQKVTFLPDGKRMIIKNENDGFMHLYLYDLTGKKLNQITSGKFEVLDICGIDAKGTKVFFTSTEVSPLETHLYSVNLNGKGKTQLTSRNGTNRIAMSEGGKYYICHHSSVTEPTTATLHKSNGAQVRVLEDNAKLRARLAEYNMPTKDFITVPNENGDMLNGYILKPHDFDSTKVYPLFMTQYSGPGSQSVSNSWGLSWEAALLAEGYLVACVDGRGTGMRGAEFKKCTYKDLGKLEVEDQIAAAKYFATLPYVDGERIGIYGWSYGGFMALNCILKGADVFKMAISVAPVTSWRFYDTIYTELYNGLPQENEHGYDDNSPLFHAEKLKGKLLIAHGTADDNVHIQNAYRMIEELLKHGKDYEWLIFPDKNHGMGAHRHALTKKMINFTKSNL